MTFDEWMTKKNQRYRSTDDTVALRLLRDCWNSAVSSECEDCAKRCEDFGKTLEVDIGDCFAEELRRD